VTTKTWSDYPDMLTYPVPPMKPVGYYRNDTNTEVMLDTTQHTYNYLERNGKQTTKAVTVERLLVSMRKS